MSLFCKLGFHKWKHYFYRDSVDGILVSGRHCTCCPKNQWSYETRWRKSRMHMCFQPPREIPLNYHDGKVGW